MKLTILKLFIHDTKKRNEFYQCLFSLLKDCQLENYFIGKGYESGYHIQIITQDNMAKQKLRAIVKNFQKMIPFNKLSKREKTLELKVIEKLGKMEEIVEDSNQRDYIFDEGTYSFESVSKKMYEQKFKMGFEEVWNILIERQKFLESYFLNQDKSYSEYVYLLLFCGIAAESYPTGIEAGSLSYRSNYEYYMKQIDLIQLNDYKKKEIVEFINRRSISDIEDEQKFISVFFEQMNYLSDPICKSFELFIQNSKEIIAKNFESNLDFNQNLYKASDFFERIESPSEFHQKFYKMPEIIDLYENKDFIIHRYVLSFLYSVFPLINISNRTKQKVIGHIATIIESQRNLNVKESVLAWNK